MTRAASTRILQVFLLLLTGCMASGRNPAPPAASGGATGTGGSPGTGGVVSATGGTSATGGATPMADASQLVADAMMMSLPDAASGGDGAAPATGDGGKTLVLSDPSTWPGGAYMKDFIIACPDGAPHEACCAHYCGCMMTNCGKQIPQDCMNACMAGVSRWDMKCRVYNCFESLNPLAAKDHQAHCEHAGVYTGSQRTRGAGDTHAKCHVAGDPDEP
jgi:hypothetical protein